MIASVADVIRSEREGGASEEDICALLNRSNIRPSAPHGWRIWSPQRLRLVAGDRPEGAMRK